MGFRVNLPEQNLIGMARIAQANIQAKRSEVNTNLERKPTYKSSARWKDLVKRDWQNLEKSPERLNALKVRKGGLQEKGILVSDVKFYFR